MESSLRCKEGKETRKLSLFDRTDRSDARNLRFIYQRSFSYPGHTKLEGGSRTGGTVQQALKKKKKKRFIFKSHPPPPLTIGDGDPWRFNSKGCKNETHQGSKVHNMSYALACRFDQFAVILTVLASSNNSDHVWCACFVTDGAQKRRRKENTRSMVYPHLVPQ